jgi:hypothetical protein
LQQAGKGKKGNRRCMMNYQSLPGKSNEGAISAERSNLVKMGDDILIYMNNSRWVLEHRYHPVWFVWIMSMFLWLPLAFLFFVIGSIILSYIWKLLWVLLLVPLFFLAFFGPLFVVGYFLEIIPRFSTSITTIDKNKKIISFEKKTSGKTKLKVQHNIASIMNIRVNVDSYESMYIYLDFYPEYADKPLCIIEASEIRDREKKIEIAHRMAEFLGVPVIEKT